MNFLEQYWQKGGTYVIPVEIINQINGEFEEKNKEIERLNKTIQIARQNILSDISMIKNEKMSKKEIINRLQSTLSLIVGSDKE